IDAAVATLQAAGLSAKRLPVACGFHSPVVAGARDRLAGELERATFHAPRLPVFSNATAAPYPDDPAAVRELLAGHLVKPVRFTEQIQAMHQAGARVFVEVGPKGVLTGLTQQILADRPHIAAAIDQPGRHGVTALQQALAALLAHGVRIDLMRLYERRPLRRLSLANLVDETRSKPLPATTWLINGAYARPLAEAKRVPEPYAIPAALPVMAPAPGTPGIAPPADAAAPFAAAALPGAPFVPAAPTQPEASPAAHPAADDVIAGFQRMMAQFLETQRVVMQAYLEGRSATEPIPGLAPPIDALTATRAPAPTLVPMPIATPASAPAPIPAPVVAAAPPAVAPAKLEVVAAGPDRAAILAALVAIAAERTGYPTDMIATDADIEADLGIDSIKRDEILGALQRELPAATATPLQAAMETLTRARTLAAIAERAADAIGTVVVPAASAPVTTAATAPTAAPAAAPVAGPSPTDLLQTLVRIAAERTGYPADMIAVDADIEADLGIDSIKRVEILGALQRDLPAGMAPALQAAMESLTRARTLEAIARQVGAAAGTAAPSPAPAAAASASGPPAPSPAGPGSPGMTRAEVLARLVAIAAERTGYPADMIAVDADIEADLGIDSIKRVEILGALQRDLPETVAQRMQAAMESLTRARTLAAIATEALAAASPARRPAPAPAAPVATAAPAATGATPMPASLAAPAPVAARAAKSAGGPLARYLLRAVEGAPNADPARQPALRGARLVITDDERGVARHLADRLNGLGAETYLMRVASIEGGDGVDLADPQATTDAVARLQEDFGSLTGIVHLLPLRGDAGCALGEPDRFRRRTGLEVKGLFHLLRAARADLKAAGARGLVVAATGQGGRFGLLPGTPLFPAGAGVAGLLKTLALESPALLVKSIDLDPTADAAGLALATAGEIQAGDPEIEVGLDAGRRYVVRPVIAPLAAPGAAENLPELGTDSVILVTGGARGITAEVTVDLARRLRPTLVVVGRSAEPPAQEAAATAAYETPAELRPVLMAALKAAGATVTPAAVDRALALLQHERDARRGLAALRAAGARVRYLACDVRDPRAVGALLDRIDSEYHRLDGVVHGAGLIEDRLIEDKEPESFARVFDTKVDSAYALLSGLRLDRLRFFAAFTSVAGRFGNRGQADY
ncbi:MAG TPA: SDR family NAD(P)-dependent oxidoreductase, partial [Dongiaceae bacterium]|nr:SDR family NAD(P)-dependent oxidoreductase [Dongiaceae bacterium]